MADIVSSVLLQWESYGYAYGGISSYNRPELFLFRFDLEWDILSEEEPALEEPALEEPALEESTLFGVLTFSWDVGFLFFSCSSCAISPFLD